MADDLSTAPGLLARLDAGIASLRSGIPEYIRLFVAEEFERRHVGGENQDVRDLFASLDTEAGIVDMYHAVPGVKERLDTLYDLVDGASGLTADVLREDAQAIVKRYEPIKDVRQYLDAYPEMEVWARHVTRGALGVGEYTLLQGAGNGVIYPHSLGEVVSGELWFTIQHLVQTHNERVKSLSAELKGTMNNDIASDAERSASQPLSNVPQPPAGKFWLIDETTRYPGVRKEMESLGGRLKKVENAWAWEFDERANFERADLIVNTFQDQTIIYDPNKLFVRDVLLSRAQPYAKIYGGTQRELADGTYAFEFPSRESAANALALVYQARQLRPEQKLSLAIINEFVKGDQAIELYGFDPASEQERYAALDQFTVRNLLGAARPMLYDLGISPSHARNIERADVILESLEADRFKEVFGFDPILEPDLHDEMKQDPIATAKVVIAGTPILRDMGINVFDELKTKRETTQETKPLDRAPERVAETALASEQIQRKIGGYVDDESERQAAQTDELNFGPERLKVLKTAREVLDLAGQTAQVVEFELGDWIQGTIIAYNRESKEIGEDEREQDIDREFVALAVTSKTSKRLNSWAKAPEGTTIDASKDRLVLSRSDGTSTAYQIETVNGEIKIAQRDGDTLKHGMSYVDMAAAQTAISALTQTARASAGFTSIKQGEVGIAILSVADFADRRFREEHKIRAGMSNKGTPCSLGFQPNGKIAYMQAHVKLGRGVVLTDDKLEHVVERPTTPELKADYEAVISLARSQLAASQKFWKGIDKDPNSIRERPLTNDNGSGNGYECQVLNEGQFYFASRVRDAIVVQEKAAFPMDRTFDIGEKFGVIYEASIPREFELDQEHMKTIDRAPEYELENVAALDDELAKALGMDEPALTPETQSLLDNQKTPWRGALMDFMERAHEQFELHEDRKVPQIGNAFKGYNQERDVVEGNVLHVDKALQLAAVTYGERFTTLNLRNLPGANLAFGDHIRVAIQDNKLTVDQHFTRAERIDRYNQKMRADIAKKGHVPAETVILRPLDMANDRFKGEIVDINPRLQYLTIAAGSKSFTTVDLKDLPFQQIALNDEITLVARDWQYTVTSRTTAKDRTLAPDTTINKELETNLARQAIGR